MRIVSAGGGWGRGSAPLVLIDAQALRERYGHAAFWHARARQDHCANPLGRNPGHWRHVAEVLRGQRAG